MGRSVFIKKFKEGDVIFRQGDEGSCAYLIDRGQVEIQSEVDGKKKPVAILGVGDIFGDMAIIDGSERSANAVALSNCECIEVSKEQLSERIEDADPIVRFLIAILLKRVRSSLEENCTMEGINLGKKEKKLPSNVIQFRPKGRRGGLDPSNDDVIHKFKLERDLKNALEENELTVHYQPVVDLQKGSIAGFEALIRWNCPERGTVRPDLFMGIAEETSLIIPIGQWVVAQSCRDFTRIKDKFLGTDVANDHLFMSVNIAPKQLMDPYLFKTIDEAVKIGGHNHRELKLEVTERILLQGTHAYEWIKKARKRGLSVALDDFGTGYSSLSYLSQLDANNLKIDKSFVQKMITDEKTRMIVKTIIELSKTLNMTVIAEGIELERERDLLRSFGCQLAQGYLTGRPMSVEDLETLYFGKSKKKAA